jgi:hypothetical protein
MNILSFSYIKLSCYPATHILKCMSSKHSSNLSYAKHIGKKINAANNLPGKKRWHFYLYYHVTRANKATIFHEASKIHNMFTNQTCDGPSKGKMHLRNTRKGHPYLENLLLKPRKTAAGTINRTRNSFVSLLMKATKLRPDSLQGRCCTYTRAPWFKNQDWPHQTQKQEKGRGVKDRGTLYNNINGNYLKKHRTNTGLHIMFQISELHRSFMFKLTQIKMTHGAAKMQIWSIRGIGILQATTMLLYLIE